MTIFELWRDLEQLGYHPTLQREDGKMTMRGVYLHNAADKLAVSAVATNYYDFEICEEDEEEDRFYFESEQDFVLIAEWNI
jgi:hypothetical protein